MRNKFALFSLVIWIGRKNISEDVSLKAPGLPIELTELVIFCKPTQAWCSFWYSKGPKLERPKLSTLSEKKWQLIRNGRIWSNVTTLTRYVPFDMPFDMPLDIPFDYEHREHQTVWFKVWFKRWSVEMSLAIKGFDDKSPACNSKETDEDSLRWRFFTEGPLPKVLYRRPFATTLQFPLACLAHFDCNRRTGCC